jgi:transposase
MIRGQDIRDRLKDIDDFLLRDYKETKEEQKRDWRTYEQRLMKRVREAIKNLEPLVDEAIRFEKHKGKGRVSKLSLKQKVILLLLKQLFGKSNRMMASMLAIFSLLSGIDVSYKTVERLYSDPEVELAVHNLHILILRKKGVKDVDASGDGTGYSLFITKHYATEAQKRKEHAKTSFGKRNYVYSFKLMDLQSKMYIAYGTSFKSEKDAFNKTMKMLETMDTNLKSVRLDKFYSYPSCVDQFGDAKVYVIPKRNATLNGSWKWKDTMAEFVQETIPYLEQYYLRNNSESGFSADKRLLGWKVDQKRDDRIDMAVNCTNLWHNLLNLYET